MTVPAFDRVMRGAATCSDLAQHVRPGVPFPAIGAVHTVAIVRVVPATHRLISPEEIATFVE